MLLLALAVAALSGTSGCDERDGSTGSLEAIWGRRGLSPGRFQKPRAIAIDAHDQLYIVDMTARIQMFHPDGTVIRSWHTPDHRFGRPSGLSIDTRGNLLVADTHYNRILIYNSNGDLLRIVGGKAGHGPGEFGLVTDAANDSKGNLYVAEYGEYDRVQKFAPDGSFLLQWGSHGSQPGQFVRPQKMVIDPDDRVWVADACNHRIQVFDSQGKLLRLWGTPGSGLGQLYYPYDLLLDGQGHVYVCEFGNHRVQKFTLDGKSLGAWGVNGKKPGQMFNPWGVARDSRGKIYVLDTNNHRVQKISL